MSLFFNFRRSEEIRTIRMKWPSDNYVIPAGTPMSESGIANDGNAIGVLASAAVVPFNYPLSVAPYVGKQEPKGNLDYDFDIIVSGFVDLNRAEASFGEKYSDEAKNAMSRINFVDSKEPQSFGGGSGGASSDWNQNDPTQPDYVKNRTHYEEQAFETIVPETEMDLSSGQYIVSETWPLEEGETYLVTWDGVEYECVCSVGSFNNIPVNFLGNTSFLGEEDTGEPFGAGVFSSFNQSGFMTADVGTHTASIVRSGEVIHKLDNKYLDLAWLPTASMEWTQFFSSETDVWDGLNIPEDVALTIADCDKLLVSFNGVEYQLSAVVSTEPVNDNGYYKNIAFGNPSLSSITAFAEIDTGEPFCLYLSLVCSYSSDEKYLALGKWVTADGATLESLIIFAETLVYNKLPEEFLAEEDQSFILTGTSFNDDYETLNNIRNALKEKGSVACEYNGQTYSVIGIAGDFAEGIVGLLLARSFWVGQGVNYVWNLWYSARNLAATLIPLLGEKALYLGSSTSGSTKKFAITVDDTGTLTATEVTS